MGESDCVDGWVVAVKIELDRDGDVVMMGTDGEDDVVV